MMGEIWYSAGHATMKTEIMPPPHLRKMNRGNLLNP